MFEKGASGPQLGHAPSPLLVPSPPHGRFTAVYTSREAKNCFILYFSDFRSRATAAVQNWGVFRFLGQRRSVVMTFAHTTDNDSSDQDSRSSRSAISLGIWPKLLRIRIDRTPLYSRAALCFWCFALRPLLSSNATFCLALPSPPPPPTPSRSR